MVKLKIPKFLILNLILGLTGFLGLNGCGVKGDPLPPESPAELGRGRPSYKRATEGVRLKVLEKEEQEEDQNESSDGEF